MTWAGTVEQEEQDATSYLQMVADSFKPTAATLVTVGPVVERLVSTAAMHGITHVVMASHGRTGMRRLILGSVADDLIHQLRIPIIVTPAFALVRETKVVAKTLQHPIPDLVPA